MPLDTVADPTTTTKNRNDKENRSRPPLQKTGELVRTDTDRVFISGLDTTDAVTITSSSEPELEPESDPGSDSPVKKKRKHRSKAQIPARKDAQSLFEVATIRTAFPADKPTSLPYGSRVKKTLSPSAIFKESKVHSSFDETKTSKLDRHTRKINTTNAAAKEKKMPTRTLEDRIGLGGLTDSDEDTPQARNGSSKVNGKEVDLQAPQDACDKDVFRDFDVMDEERDLLSDDDDDDDVMSS
jgi:hypothetical protein